MRIKFKQFEKQLTRTLKQHMPVILTGIGVVGVGGTAYLTHKAAFEAAERIRKAEEDKRVFHTIEQSKLTKKEMIQKTWTLYLPAAGVATLTCMAIVCGQRMSMKRLSSATAALAVTERAYSEYKEKVHEIVGDKKEKVIRDTIAQDKVNSTPVPPDDSIFGNGEVLFMDAYSGRPFFSSHEEINAAINHMNNLINREGESNLSEFYGWIGLGPTKISDQMGWRGYELPELALSPTRTDDNRPCFVVDFNPAPTFGYLSR